MSNIVVKALSVVLHQSTNDVCTENDKLKNRIDMLTEVKVELSHREKTHSVGSMYRGKLDSRVVRGRTMLSVPLEPSSHKMVLGALPLIELHISGVAFLSVRYANQIALWVDEGSKQQMFMLLQDSIRTAVLTIDLAAWSLDDWLSLKKELRGISSNAFDYEMAMKKHHAIAKELIGATWGNECTTYTHLEIRVTNVALRLRPLRSTIRVMPWSQTQLAEAEVAISVDYRNLDFDKAIAALCNIPPPEVRYV